jgi:hypothetical protein
VTVPIFPKNLRNVPRDHPVRKRWIERYGEPRVFEGWAPWVQRATIAQIQQVARENARRMEREEAQQRKNQEEMERIGLAEQQRRLEAQERRKERELEDLSRRIPIFKSCTHCYDHKLIEEFTTKMDSQGLHHSWCKSCMAEVAVERRARQKSSRSKPR